MEFSKVIGLDLGDKHTHFCALDAETGTVEAEGKFRTSPAHLTGFFEGRKTCRVVMEAGTHAAWMQKLLVDCGHEVIIANPRKVRMRGATNKNDKVDAEFLARLGRADPKLLYPVVPRAVRVQEVLGLIRSREQLIRARTSLVNHVRGIVKAHGMRMPSSSTRKFHELGAVIGEQLKPALVPIMKSIEVISEEIANLDREVTRLCREEFPETAKLTQVPGVGDLTALTYVAIVEDPGKFRSSRAVGAFVGLVPRQRQSGGQNPQLGIHKAGDPILRRILVQSANYILGPFGPPTDLRVFGERIAARGGKNAKKRARVAVARKLATLLHALWKSGATYGRQREVPSAA